MKMTYFASNAIHQFRNPSRTIALIFCSIRLLQPIQAADEPSYEGKSFKNAFEGVVKPFLMQHCERCHDADKLTSGIRVDQLNAGVEDRHIRLWQEIGKQIVDKAMPPEDEPQPTEAQRQAVITWIQQALKTARSRPLPNHGVTRRLTVAQYRNTMKELLLLDDNLTDLLPPDSVSRDGFVNNQETLLFSPLLIEAYFEVAEESLRRCIVESTSKPTIQNFRVELGDSINPQPFPDPLILGAGSLLLNNKDVLVKELTPNKPFDFEPFAMRTKYRFIEGYAGNDTVRGWREYDSLYHCVFACMRGTDGYPKGRAYSTVPQGLLLRPAIPSSEVFQVESTYGPKANFKISLRELPEGGLFRVRVMAAKYNDGLLLDPGDTPQVPEQSDAVLCHDLETPQTVTIPHSGIYQVDVYPSGTKSTTPSKKPKEKPNDLTISLGDREFTGTLSQPAFLVLRLDAGELSLKARHPGSEPLDKVVLTPVSQDHEIAKRFAFFEQRSPKLGVHLGLRRDCGSTLAPVGEPQIVSSDKLTRFDFEGSIRNFPSPDVEKDNINYLAGIREIGVRSEYTDGRDMPRLLIRSVEFEGPFYEQWPPPAHQNIFIESDQSKDSKAYAREILRAFASRAYRRPISLDEETQLMNVFEQSSADGGRFQDNVTNALHVVLTSPQFLFVIEDSKSPESEPLNENELASKLSYFLWNGPPDQGLMTLAANGNLSDQLQAEVGRMIDDPRFSLFISEFASQWLALDKFSVLEPDRDRFPKLTRDTRTQLRQEPIQFLEYLIRNNLALKNVIESDFLLANEVIASYYELADRTESGFEFVPVAHNRKDLGGMLTQAAIMAGLSDGRESNPVKRGAWLARRIIAEPPDDPPPNVPTLTEDTQGLSLRERIERHRNQPGCVQCHLKIDPWGIPFEEFDAGGRLKRQSVDARSTLPDKSHIAGVNDLKRYLSQDRIDQVAFSFLKHLATYATGRNLAYNELESLRESGKALKADGYRMQDMIRFVIQSDLFLKK
jgi:hypothetical protein